MGVARSIDVTADQRKTILALLKRHLPNTTAWVYGSRVKWTSRPQSDLDLVVFTKPDQQRQVSELREAFEESNLPFRIDLFVWDAVPEQFRKQIEAEHVVLASKRAERANVDWCEMHWGAIATLEYGRALRGYDAAQGSFRVFGTNGPIGWHDETLCEHASVIVGRKGAYRGIHYSAAPFFVIDTAFYLKPKVEMDVRWAYYTLLTQDINGMDSGSAIPSTNREEFYGLPVSIPPLPEQRAIAHVLGTLDDKIELNRRMNETLEAMARALFKSWFIDFDPVRAKMSGREPGLPQHLADFFPDRFVDSELGPIPEGWEVKALDEIAHFQNGLALQKFRPTENERRLPVVKIAQLRSGQVDSGEWATENIAPECIVDDGDIIFSWSGSLMVKIWCGGRAALNQHLFKVTSSKYPKWFYLHYIETHLPEFQSIAVDKTTTMGHIKRHHLSEAKCAVPDLTRFAVADDTFSALLTKRISNVLGSNTLTALRDTLLPKLISGEIRINRDSVDLLDNKVQEFSS